MKWQSWRDYTGKIREMGKHHSFSVSAPRRRMITHLNRDTEMAKRGQNGIQQKAITAKNLKKNFF